MSVKTVTAMVLDALGDELRLLLDLEIKVSAANGFDYIDIYRDIRRVLGSKTRIICRVDLFRDSMYVFRPNSTSGAAELTVPMADPDCFAKIIEMVLNIIEVDCADKA